MKHLILINKHAGNSNDLLDDIESSFKGLEYEIYKTKAPKDATKFLKEYFKKEKEQTRVYACGGDGTLQEAVTGIAEAKNAELALYAVGTGNDFAKIYGGVDKFHDFKTLINTKATPIDISILEGESLDYPLYSINVINFGFDAIVGAMGNFYKENGIPSDAPSKFKDDPYGYALKYDAMKHGRYNNTIVYADGEKLNEKQMLLCTLAQGQYVGGKFHAAPKSDNKDGLIDVCLIKTMPLLQFGLFVKPYTYGKHLNKKNRKIIYRKAKEINIVAPNDIDICVDGEMCKGKEFTVKVIPNGINFVIPE